MSSYLLMENKPEDKVHKTAVTLCLVLKIVHDGTEMPPLYMTANRFTVHPISFGPYVDYCHSFRSLLFKWRILNV